MKEFNLEIVKELPGLFHLANAFLLANVFPNLVQKSNETSSLNPLCFISKSGYTYACASHKNKPASRFLKMPGLIINCRESY